MAIAWWRLVVHDLHRLRHVHRLVDTVVTGRPGRDGACVRDEMALVGGEFVGFRVVFGGDGREGTLASALDLAQRHGRVLLVVVPRAVGGLA